MNLELIKHTFLHHEFDSPEQETYIMRGHIDRAIKELGEIKRNLGTAIADMNRTGDDSGLQEVYTDLDAFLNPEIYADPTSQIDYTSKKPDLDSYGHEIDYKKRYEAIVEQAQLKLIGKHECDADDICEGCYKAGLDDALDPLVQANLMTRNKALLFPDSMATIEADGEVTYE